jgi:hypothetical protein
MSDAAVATTASAINAENDWEKREEAAFPMLSAGVIATMLPMNGWPTHW